MRPLGGIGLQENDLRFDFDGGAHGFDERIGRLNGNENGLIFVVGIAAGFLR